MVWLFGGWNLGYAVWSKLVVPSVGVSRSPRAYILVPFFFRAFRTLRRRGWRWFLLLSSVLRIVTLFPLRFGSLCFRFVDLNLDIRTDLPGSFHKVGQLPKVRRST